jgi:hypothetical protein
VLGDRPRRPPFRHQANQDARPGAGCELDRGTLDRQTAIGTREQFTLISDN